MAYKKSTRTRNLRLPCKLTGTEINERQKALAVSHGVEADEEVSLETAKEAVKEVKKKIADEHTTQRELAKEINSGETARMVECEIAVDMKSNSVITIRKDTFEPVREAAISSGDRQMFIDEMMHDVDAGTVVKISDFLAARKAQKEMGLVEDDEPEEEEIVDLDKDDPEAEAAADSVEEEGDSWKSPTKWDQLHVGMAIRLVGEDDIAVRQGVLSAVDHDKRVGEITFETIDGPEVREAGGMISFKKLGDVQINVVGEEDE